MTAPARLALPGLTARLGPEDAAAVAAARARLAAADVVARIWARDHTVWAPGPEEIADRLGWLDDGSAMRRELTRLTALAEAARADGLDHVALIGMGGSSLAPEVMARLAADPAAPGLTVLDSTHPDAVRAADAALDPARTLFVVSSKSGTTVETATLARHAFARVTAALGDGEAAAGGHFVAITDPGSPLADTARRDGYRALFVNRPDVGGRFSALTFFGLVPAALCGVDLARLLEGAEAARRRDGAPEGPERAGAAAGVAHPGVALGALLGALAGAGRPVATLVAAPRLRPLGAWIEQLVAESTGKDGRGILPLVGEPVEGAAAYRPDRVFVHLRTAADAGTDRALGALADAGHPVVVIDVGEPVDLGGQFALWMMATAVAGHVLGVQPFDQPDVEAAKRRARALLAADGPDPTAAFAPADPVALGAFLDAPADYVALLAWAPPGAAVDAALDLLRAAARGRTGAAVTVAYGPRYLHSAGQLHKGDAGRGRFVALFAPPGADLALAGGAPGETLGRLARAQAAGDLEALAAAGRPVLGLRLADGAAPEAALRALAGALAAG